MRRAGRALGLFLAALVIAFAVVGVVDWRDGSGHGVWKPQLGLDVQGGTRITLTADPEVAVDAADLAVARDVVQRRVDDAHDGAGVRTRGDRELVVEVPGTVADDLPARLARSGQLSVRVVWTADSTGATTPATSTGEAVDWSSLSLGDALAASSQGLGALPSEYQEAAAALQSIAQNTDCTSGTALVTSVDRPTVSCDPTTGEALILSPALVDSARISDASSDLPQGNLGWSVDLELDEKGTESFDQITAALLDGGGQYAVLLDHQVASVTVPDERVTDGRLQVTGLSEIGATEIVGQVDHGALPVSLTVADVVDEGPAFTGAQLKAAAAAIGAGLLAGLVLASWRRRLQGVVTAAGLAGAALLGYLFLVSTGSYFRVAVGWPTVGAGVAGLALVSASAALFVNRAGEASRSGKAALRAVEVGWERSRAVIVTVDAVVLFAGVALAWTLGGAVRAVAVVLAAAAVVALLVVSFLARPLTAVLARRGWPLASPEPLAGPRRDPRRGYLVAVAVLAVALVGLVVGGTDRGSEARGGMEFTATVASADADTVRELADAVGSTGVASDPVLRASGAGTIWVQTGPLSDADADEVAGALTKAGATDVAWAEIGPEWSDGSLLRIAVGLAVAVLLAVALVGWRARSAVVAAVALATVLVSAASTAGLHAWSGGLFDLAAITALLAVVVLALVFVALALGLFGESTRDVTSSAVHTFDEHVDVAAGRARTALSAAVLTAGPVALALLVAGWVVGGPIADTALILTVGVLAAAGAALLVAVPVAARIAGRDPAVRAHTEKVLARRSGSTKKKKTKETVSSHRPVTTSQAAGRHQPKRTTRRQRKRR
ncbi:MAG: hypothetical protein QM621_06500 [Aeromicrobium sp.]|uniref:SecDF P1 head subdomain-containing protein n=1 Tax=Aeromicrobium sp. TaxID=1871063 RepID=UPI0039E51BFA